MSLFLKNGKFSTLIGDFLEMTTDYKFDTNKFSGCKTEYKNYKKICFDTRAWGERVKDRNRFKKETV